mmetsp:Transcript_41999/g.120076  ORF Transcript_41999/g.120076 Transcript_41999/m.120076 type:complete len:290 (-) Transcript_41999:279-1148(-)
MHGALLVCVGGTDFSTFTFEPLADLHVAAPGGDQHQRRVPVPVGLGHGGALFSEPLHHLDDAPARGQVHGPRLGAHGGVVHRRTFRSQPLRYVQIALAAGVVHRLRAFGAGRPHVATRFYEPLQDRELPCHDRIVHRFVALAVLRVHIRTPVHVQPARDLQMAVAASGLQRRALDVLVVIGILPPEFLDVGPARVQAPNQTEVTLRARVVHRGNGIQGLLGAGGSGSDLLVGAVEVVGDEGLDRLASRAIRRRGQLERLLPRDGRLAALVVHALNELLTTRALRNWPSQ